MFLLSGTRTDESGSLVSAGLAKTKASQAKAKADAEAAAAAAKLKAAEGKSTPATAPPLHCSPPISLTVSV